jgi:hypothetical protein
MLSSRSFGAVASGCYKHAQFVFRHRKFRYAAIQADKELGRQHDSVLSIFPIRGRMLMFPTNLRWLSDPQNLHCINSSP